MASNPISIADEIWPDITNGRQPQQLLKLADNDLTEGIVSFVYPISGYDLVSRKALRFGSASVRSSGPKGRAWQGATANADIDIGASGGIGSILDQTKPWSIATRVYLDTVGITQYLLADFSASAAGPSFTLAADPIAWFTDGYRTSGAVGSHAYGGTPTIGYHDLLVVFSGGSAFNVSLWVDGIFIGKGSNSNSAQHAGSSLRLLSRGAYTQAYGLNGSLLYSAIWQGDKSNYVQQLRSNPWRLLKAPDYALFGGFIQSSATIFLTGSSQNQANASTSGAIVQTNILAGVSVSQVNSSTSGALVQTNKLLGAGADQANSSTTGVLTQTHVLSGSNASQVNNSSTGALLATQTLSGSNASQVNTSDSGLLVQGQILSGASADQANNSTSGALVQTQILTGANVNQSNTVSVGALTQTYILSGADVSQTQGSGAGAVTQTNALSGSNASQANNSASGVLVQTNVLSGTNADQHNSSSSGALTIGNTTVLTGSNASVSNTSTTGSLLQTQTLSGADVEQFATSSVGDLIQGQILSGANVSQDATSSNGALVQTHVLTGADVSQVNNSTSGILAQVQTLSGADVAQSNSSSSGALVILSSAALDTIEPLRFQLVLNLNQAIVIDKQQTIVSNIRRLQ